MSEKTSFLVPHSIWELVESLTIEERGELFTAMLQYSMGKDIGPISRYTQIAFASVKPILDADAIKYRNVCESRREAGRKGGLQKQANVANASFATKNLANVAEYDIDNDIKKKDTLRVSKEKRFTPPTLDEVREYIRSNNYNVDPERWLDYYTSNGWMVGKNHMKDWKAAIRTWSKGGRERGSSVQRAEKQSAPNRFHNYQQRQTDYDALLDSMSPFGKGKA